MAEKTCGHAACSCAMDPDRMYCSESCRQAAEVPTPVVQTCQCGHVECVGDTARKGKRSLSRGVFQPETS